LLGFYAEVPPTHFWAVAQIAAFGLVRKDVKIEKDLFCVSQEISVLVLAFTIPA